MSAVPVVAKSIVLRNITHYRYLIELTTPVHNYSFLIGYILVISKNSVAVSTQPIISRHRKFKTLLKMIKIGLVEPM